MRVLLFSPVVPSPFRGRRPYNFLRCLAPKHEVRVLALPYQHGGIDDAHRLKVELGAGVRLLPQSRAASAAACLPALVRRDIPLRALYCTHRHVARALEEEIAAWQPDLVHIDRLRLAHYRHCTDGVPTVVDLPDALALYYDRLLTVPLSPLQRLVARSERAAIRRYEQEHLHQVDAVLVCSPVDRDYLAAYAPGANYALVTNATDTELFRPRPVERASPPRLLFTGTVSYPPNLDGLRWYLERIAPILDRMGVPSRPTVAGVDWRPRAVRAALRGHPVEWLGFVDDLARELSPNDLYLCPLRVGAGVRNKLLEAMAAGMACVSTTLGFEGMEVQPGVQLLAGDSPEAFAEAVRRAYNDADLRRSLGEAARRYVVEHHDLRAVGRQLESLYRSLVAPRAPAR